MSKSNELEPQGYLPHQTLKEYVRNGYIFSERTLREGQFQPASIDLRLGETAYRIRSSFLPDSNSVDDKLKDLEMYRFDIRDGAVFEKGSVYLVPLLEELRLPNFVQGETNPKSTTGRLDIFTRVVTDRCHRFDEIMPGYEGKMFLQVISRSFAIRVHTGLSLNQLRLHGGSRSEWTITDSQLRDVHSQTGTIFDCKGTPFPNDKLVLDMGLFISVSLLPVEEKEPIGYKAKKNSDILDLSKDNYYRIEDFFEPVFPDRKGFIILEPEEFYVLMSYERLSIPPSFVAEMIPYEPNSGELRTHYAGFFDPGFGYGKGGTNAVLEVRAHDVPFMVTHMQTFCRLNLKKTASPANILYGEDASSHYQFQRLTLSKHFKYSSPPSQPPQEDKSRDKKTLPLFEKFEATGGAV